MFGDYLKCFNNRMVQGNKTNIMFESKWREKIMVWAGILRVTEEKEDQKTNRREQSLGKK